MKQSSCELVRNGKQQRKGNACCEGFDKNGKKLYSCYGFMDLMTEEPLEECRRCEICNQNADFKYI